MNGRYILDEKGVPVPCEDLIVWGKWLERADSDRIVKQTTRDKVKVSTVFLGLDHSFGLGEGPPILFETMIFGGEHDDYQQRYATREEALMGHEEAEALVWGRTEQ